MRDRFICRQSLQSVALRWLGRGRAGCSRRRRLSSCRLLRIYGSGRRANLDFAAFLQFVLSIGDNNVSRCHSARNIGHVLLNESDRHRPNIHGIVRFRHEHVSALGAPLNRCRRNDRAVLANLQQQSDIHKLIRPERVVFVFKHRLQTTSACALIDLVVDRQEFPPCQLGLIVAAVGIDFQRAFCHVLRHRRKLILGQSEQHGDGLQLSDDQKRIGISRMDDVARIYQSQAHAATDW